MTEHRETHDTDDAHPLGTTVGATAGAVAGGAIGTAVAGPIGAVLGAILGGAGGGKVGHELADVLDDPTLEDAYWRENFKKRPYVQHDEYAVYRPAYSFGWNARRYTLGSKWEEVEDEMREGWESFEDQTRLTWLEAREAVRDGWDRIERRFGELFRDQDDHWRTHFGDRPYVKEGEAYETYRPAYQYGWRERVRRWGARWEDVEDDLEKKWDRFVVDAKLTWLEAKEAVRDAWNLVERRIPGDFDRDGR